MTATSKNSNAGGAANAGGVSFQAEVAALFAAHLLSDRPIQAIWNGPDARVIRIAMEARMPVDDVIVHIHDGRRLFIQAKTSASLSTAEGSDFLSFVEQAIRLFIPLSASAPEPPVAPFVSGADAILLAVSPTSPATVRLHLKQALDLTRTADTVATARTSLNNDSQKGAFDTILKAIEISEPSPLADDAKLRLLQSIHVAEFDTHGADKRAAVALLSYCLERPGDAEAAIDVLAHHAQQLMKDRGTTDSKSLRAKLLLAKVPLSAPPSYAKDVERLRQYSKQTLATLRAQQSISSAGRDIAISRECVPNVCSAILSDHLLLLGEPGAGKTAVIAETAMTLASQADVIVLAVDQLSGADLQGLAGDLGLTCPVLELLDNWPEAQPVVLCIDALDASRGGPTEAAVLALITNVIGKLSDRVKVLSSIRTFDLKMGARYRSLFAGAAPAPTLSDRELLNVRHILVPIWTDTELARLLREAPRVADALSKSPTVLHDLVRVPFNSRLLAMLLDDGRPPDSFTGIHGQADLLAAFWDRRVAPLAPLAHNALIETVDHMIDLQQLRAPYAKLSAHQGLTDLLRAALLVVYDNRHVAFRHHILFDYTVSRLRIDASDLPTLQHSLDKTKGLGFLLAPALGYALGALWAEPTKQPFWDLVFRLVADPAIDPVARVKISRMAVDLPASEADIEPLIANIRSARDLRAPAAALSSAILAGNEAGMPPAPWDAFIDALADTPQRYSESCRSLLYWALNNPANTSSPRLGSAARRLLSFALHAQPAQRSLALSAIDATARTFAIDPQASRAGLLRLFEPQRLIEHAHAEVPWLCRHIEIIASHDPEFAVEIYRRVFSHAVITNAPTRMGNSQILSLSSNAKQDYGMAYWSLAEKFPSFLRAKPQHATRALIAALGGYTARDHANSLSQIAQTIEASNRTVRLRPDGSYIWASDPDGTVHCDAERMLTAFVNWLRVVPIDDATLVIATVCRENELGVVWARCFMVAAERCDAIADHLASFAMHPSFIHCSDTKKDAVDLSAAALARRPQAEREAFIAAIEASDFSPYNDPVGAKTALLRRLTDAIGRRLPTPAGSPSPATGQRDSNDRLVRFESSYGAPEDWWWIKRQGVDTDKNDNGPVLTAAKALNGAKDAFKASRTDEVGRQLMHDIGSVDALRSAHGAADRPVLDYVDDVLCKAVQTVLDERRITLTADDLALARKIALRALKSSNPEGGAEAEASFENFPSWSSPAPRAEAATLVITLARHDGQLDDQLRKCIDAALADSNPVVRHHVTIRLNCLWDIDRGLLWTLFRRVSESEPNRGVLKYFLNYPVGRLTRAAPDKIEDVLAILWNRFEADTSKPGVKLREEIADLTAVLGLYENVSASSSRLQSWLGEADAHRSELTHVVQTLRDGLTLGFADSKPDLVAIRRRCSNYLHQVVATAAATLETYYAHHRTASAVQADQARAAAELLDRACMQLLFAIKPSNPQNEKAANLDQIGAASFANENRATLQRLAEVGTPSIVHHLLDLLEVVLPAAPATVFDLSATALLVAGPLHGYANESLALDQFVRLVGRFLADHRELFHNASRRDRLIAMIDCFMDAGWPEARKLLNSLPDLLR